jgi:LysR family transcriptional regulator (chromosome initiation inhibitor)
MRPDLAQLEALAAVVSEGTFEAAARALNVTPSAISQRIKALENEAGQVLLARSKPISPTAAGQTLLRLARQIALVTADATAEIGGSAQSNGQIVVPIAVNADSLATWVLPALASVAPPTVFDVRREDQTRTAELLRQGTVMAAVTAAAEVVPGCSVERLGRMRYRPMASAAFAEQWFGAGVTAETLSLAPVVVFDRADELQDRYLRRRSRRRLRPPRHHIPASADFVQAVRLGLGWAMVPDLQVTSPGLVDLDPDRSLYVTLHWQQWRIRSTALDETGAAIRAAARGLR